MSANIDNLGFAARVARYLQHAATTQHAVPNLVTCIDSVGSGDARMPVTINRSEPNESWVCSPYTAFARYAAEEASRFGHPVFGPPLGLLCRTLGLLLKHGGIDHAVGLNNWTLSTNLYPRLARPSLQQWIDECVQRWPDCAIWFRSLNSCHTPDWLAALEEMGCELVPSRQVYLYDRIDTAHADMRRDLRLLERSSFIPSAAHEWSAADFARAEKLYRLLYLDKYSQLNPAYSAHWLQTWSRCGLLDLSGYRDQSGKLVAVIGMFSLEGTTTAPIVGYDTSLPQSLGLYRLLMATVFREAVRRPRRINLSAGAASFKKLRGGVGAIEYSAVWVKHLRGRRRRSVQWLGSIGRAVGEPLLRRYGL